MYARTSSSDTRPPASLPAIWLKSIPSCAIILRTVGEAAGGTVAGQDVGTPMLKVRTLRPGAEDRIGQYLGEELVLRTEAELTRVGRWLKASQLDEIPQLINVLRGEMSIVGPRPERPEFVELLEESIPFWSRRHLLRPGITGWAQLRSGYAADALATEEKLSYDLWYLRHQSLIVDALICARTVPSLLLAVGR